MELTVQNVFGLLLRSQLLPLDEARSMFSRWQDESKDQSTNVVKFASWMVANKYLTEYQATLLARGHADGFFLGDYKILDRLGKGRMAGVFKARHKLGQVVAIKVLPPSKAKDATLLARFQREARLATKLRHPNIVRTFQMGTAGAIYYLVMEYLDGETLEDVLLRRNRFPPAEAVRLIYQALQGLQHIQDQGMVHRDLKPANLMLVPVPKKDDTTHCTVKILDVGLGRGLVDSGNEDPEAGLTSEGVLLGTPDYMAPEQARDPRNTDVRADVYSLGCVLYHLLAGQPPFPDSNIISQMIKHATEPAKPLKEFNPAIPDGLQQIVNWMLAKDPAQRYPTPSRAFQALEMYLMAGAPPSSPDLDPEMQPYIKHVDEENERQGPPPLPPTVPHVSIPVAKPVAAAVATAAPVAQAVPAAKPPAPVPVPAAAGNVKPSEGKAKHKKERGKKRPPPPPPATGAVTAEPAPAGFDVELVPTQAPARSGVGLTRRDFAMFFAGAGISALAWFLGSLAAKKFAKEAEEQK